MEEEGPYDVLERGVGASSEWAGDKKVGTRKSTDNVPEVRPKPTCIPSLKSRHVAKSTSPFHAP